MNNTRMPTFFEKFAMVSIILGPILNIYASPLSMSLSAFITAILSVIYFCMFISKRGSIRERSFWYGLGFYFLYRGVTTLIYGILPIAIIEQFLGFFMAFGCFHRDYYIKSYKTISLIAIVFFFIQFFGYLTTGVRLGGIIKFLPLQSGYDTIGYLNKLTHADRSSSFFSEPSHFAQFLLPLLAVELFYDKSPKHLRFSGVIFVVLLLLQSGTGFWGLVPIALFLIPFYLGNNTIKRSKRIITILFILLIVAGSVYLFINSQMGDSVLVRTEELESDYEGGNRSGFLRIWRGYFVFADYSVLEKVFGVANPDGVLFHIRNSGMFFGIDVELYFNAIQDILLYSGYLGLFMFFVVIRHIWVGNTICGKAIIGSLIAISFVEHIYFSNIMLVHLLLAESMKNKYSTESLEY